MSNGTSLWEETASRQGAISGLGGPYGLMDDLVRGTSVDPRYVELWGIYEAWVEHPFPRGR